MHYYYGDIFQLPLESLVQNYCNFLHVYKMQ